MGVPQAVSPDVIMIITKNRGRGVILQPLNDIIFIGTSLMGMFRGQTLNTDDIINPESAVKIGSSWSGTQVLDKDQEPGYPKNQQINNRGELMKMVRSILRFWLTIAVGVSVVFLVIYASVQQVYRSNADDPQIELAEQVSRLLGAGQPIESVIPSSEVDVSHSLAVFMIVFDENGAPIDANARLDGQIPVPPPGVLENAKINGQNRITWQPRSGVRSAIVVLPVSGQFTGYVLVGRSLREVEIRAKNLVKMVGLGWLVALSCTLFLTIIWELIPFTRSQ